MEGIRTVVRVVFQLWIPNPNGSACNARGHDAWIWSMTRRCRWCGRFVAAGAEPIPGVNRYGVLLEQLLCPVCAPSWRDLSARNQAALEKASQ